MGTGRDEGSRGGEEGQTPHWFWGRVALKKREYDPLHLSIEERN